jgi:pyruvate dehydrogenase E2 component (dihydrolipoamide acetyltransferase)
MPKQGQSVESCIVNELKKKQGDTVKKGDILFSYETDKASFEEESPVDGVVLACFFNEGDEVPVLENVMIIGEPGEDISALASPESPKTAQVETPKPTVETLPTISSQAHSRDAARHVFTQPTATGETKISPRAKNLATSQALDTTAISGTGPQGRIIERDVQAALQNRPKLTPLARKMVQEEDVQPQNSGTGLAGQAKSTDLAASQNAVYSVDYEDKKISNMRKLIAKSMHASLQNSAQLTHHLGADARRILELRKQAKVALDAGKISTNITLNDMVCSAVIKALKQFPNVNTHFLGDTIRYFNKVHLGLAVDTERGLMVPVIRNADDLSIIGLANQFKEVAAACRKGNVNPEILVAEAGTFTVSNLGNYGVEMFTPVVNLPQSAILGVNTIIPRPKDLGNGVYAFVPYIGLSLTYDHRSLDGGEATRFLKQIAIEIENFESFL